MELIPEWAPNIHPMLVHFPIAIILLAVLLDFLNFFLPDEWWDELKTTILYGIGTLSAIIVYYSGTLAADSVFLPSGAQSVLNEHADWAWWTVWFFGAYTVLRILLHRYKAMDRKSIRTAVFVLALPGLFLVYETGNHGAKMVFGYGAGTGQLLEQEQGAASVPADSLMAEGGSTFTVEDNGDWSWAMGPKAVSTLLKNFRWLEGSAQEIQPSSVSSNGNYLLELTVDSTNSFFVGRNSYQNVQVDYYLDISNFEGTVSLITHAQDASNYDFVSLHSDGTITQGRVRQGNREEFAEESYTASGMIFVRVVGNGTHFRGYINKEMVIHGHGDAPEAGSVGLRLDGTGTVIIDRVSLTQLNES